MSDQLTGAELALAVAKLMPFGHMAWIGSISYPAREAVYICPPVPEGPTHADEFDPINNGSDFDAVLMWAIGKNLAIYLSRLDISVGWWQDTSPDAHAELDGDADPVKIRRAVLEAIVEVCDD